MSIKSIELPTVTLPSGQRTIRRLGLDDIGRMADIFEAAVEAYQEKNGWRVGLSLNSQEGMLRFALAGIERADEIATPFLASLIGMTPEEFRDPEKMPLPAITELVMGLMQHHDLLQSAYVIRMLASKAKRAVEKVKGEAAADPKGVLASLFGWSRTNGGKG